MLPPGTPFPRAWFEILSFCSVLNIRFMTCTMSMKYLPILSSLFSVQFYKTQKKDPLTRVLFLFQMVEISTRSTSASVLPLRRHFTSTRAVSMAVRHGMESSTALRRIFTLSWEGMRPLDDVEIT